MVLKIVFWVDWFKCYELIVMGNELISWFWEFLGKMMILSYDFVWMVNLC
jgi:hypothetical protein